MACPSCSGWDRVAPSRSVVIPAGDGLPLTHTQPASKPDRMVTRSRRRRGPLPFVANLTVAEWVLFLAITLVCASMAAVPAWIVAGSSDVAAAVGGTVTGFCVLMALPAMAGHRNPVERDRRNQADIDAANPTDQSSDALPVLGRVETRRAEDAGRSPKRRPEGRGAAGGGDETRPLGNSQFLLRPDVNGGQR